MPSEPVRQSTNGRSSLIAARHPARRRKSNDLQQRQSQYREIVAVHALEQLNAKAFELIAADACRRRVAGRIEIEVEELVRRTNAWSAARRRHARTARLRPARTRSPNGVRACGRKARAIARAPPPDRPAWQSIRRRAQASDRRRASAGLAKLSPLQRLLPAPNAQRSRRAPSTRPAIPSGAHRDRLHGFRSGYPQPRAIVCRALLREASTSGSPASHSGIDRSLTRLAGGGARRDAPGPRRPFLRSNAGSRRSAANYAWRKAGARRRSPRLPPADRYIGRRRGAL